MHVVVDDGHARQAARARMRRGDGDVVEEAEAHRPVALGVMPGRPDERQRARAGLAVEDMLDRA